MDQLLPLAQMFGVSGSVIVGIIALLYLVIPALGKSASFTKFQNWVDIAIHMVQSIEQEFFAQAPVKAAGMSDADYQAAVDAFNAKKKQTCMDNIKIVLADLKLPIPSDVILSMVIEGAVGIMNTQK